MGCSSGRKAGKPRGRQKDCVDRRPPSACSRVDEHGLIGEERVRGDPRGPGGPPHRNIDAVTGVELRPVPGLGWLI